MILSKFANLSLPIYCTFLVVREYYKSNGVLKAGMVQSKAVLTGMVQSKAVLTGRVVEQRGIVDKRVEQSELLENINLFD